MRSVMLVCAVFSSTSGFKRSTTQKHQVKEKSVLLRRVKGSNEWVVENLTCSDGYYSIFIFLNDRKLWFKTEFGRLKVALFTIKSSNTTESAVAQILKLNLILTISIPTRSTLEFYATLSIAMTIFTWRLEHFVIVTCWCMNTTRPPEIKKVTLN